MSTKKRSELSERARKLIAAAAIAVFILLTLAIAWFVGRPMLRFVSEPEHFRAWVDSGGVMSRVYFLGMQLLQVFFAVIPGEPMELGAGYAFGAVEGTLLCLGGTILGSMAVFFFVRRFGVRAVEIFFTREKIESLHFLKNPRKRNALMFLLILIPGTPKDLLGYFAPHVPAHPHPRHAKGSARLLCAAHRYERLDLAFHHLCGQDTVYNHLYHRRQRPRRAELRIRGHSPGRHAAHKRRGPAHIPPHLPRARGALEKGGGGRRCRISCSLPTTSRT